MKVNIRRGIKSDLPKALVLIKELASFEKSSDQVTNTLSMMEEDGFGANPVFGFFVADVSNEIVGLSLYYYRYSTWKGKRLYLEDIIVTERCRGKGIGKLLFEETMRFCIEQHCTGMMWQVLDWNKSAIDFYRKYDARIENDWLNCHLEAAQIEKILNKNLL